MKKILKIVNNSIQRTKKIFYCTRECSLLSAKISLYYFTIGMLWILFSDSLLGKIVSDKDLLTRISTFKGSVYVFITALILYLLIRKSFLKISEADKKLEESYNRLSITYRELEEANEEISSSEEELKQQVEEIQKSQKALYESEERYRLALEGVNDNIWDSIWENGKQKYIYSRTKQMLGYREEELEDTVEAWAQLIHADDLDKVREKMIEHFEQKLPFYSVEYRVRAKDGQYKWILSRGKAIFDSEGKPLRMVGSHTDITDKKMYEEKIHYLAFHDTLTGLPNKIQFLNKVGEAIKCIQRGHKAAIIYMDLDNFKLVNDTLGHNIGDLLLIKVSEAFISYIDRFSVITRLSGDEFAIFLADIVDISQITELTEKILRMFTQPFIIHDNAYYITASIGITVFPEDGETSDILLKNADTAMYNSKSKGRNCYSYFSNKMNSSMANRLEIESNLRKAIENNEFVLYYQPIFDIHTHEMIAAEALVRWVHPVKGMIAPMEFIPIAEKSGLITSIDEWVLRHACGQYQMWKSKGVAPIKLAVNLSAKQFREYAFVNVIDHILSETKMDPVLLQLEITEGIAIWNIDRTIEILKDLRNKGIGISLDDFGTGYSSLSYLSKFPINTLKIDKSFVQSIHTGCDEEIIIDAVLTIARKMNIEVTAEGVETEEQLKYLTHRGCNHAQGYLLGKPLPVHEFERLLTYFQT